MEQQINRFQTYFEDMKKQCNEKITELREQERGDEANLEKVRLNIYDIFLTMFEVSLKSSSDAKKVGEAFLQKLDIIPKNWRASYKKAEEFGDEEKSCIEEIKLNTVEEIRNSFHQIWEDFM